MMTPDPLLRDTVSNSTKIELDADHVVEVSTSRGGTTISLTSRSKGYAVDVEVEFGTVGPVVRIQAPRVEIQSEEWNVSCNRFEVQAKESIDMSTTGSANVSAARVSVNASPGAIRLRANDDVQLLGEQILLNCDRTPPMPPWVPQPRTQPASLPPSRLSGDDAVLSEMLSAAEPNATDQ